MLNLFVAVIISDFEKLNYESQKQDIINMAQYSVLVEKILPDRLLERMKVEDSLTICLHDLCRKQETKQCNGTYEHSF